MKVITIANQKGGTGKTTTALCLGAQLERIGYKVLYVDLDKQCDSTRTLNASMDAKGSYDMLADKTPANEVIQITDGGRHVIASNDKIATIDALLNDPKNQLGKEYRLKESLESVKDLYDYVVIDTATDLNNATINALTTADYLVISSTADDYSKEGLLTLLNITDIIRQYTNKNLKTAGVLLIRYNDRSNINKAYKEEISRIAGEHNTKVFNTYIRENTAIRESQALKQPITEYAPKSNGNIDYMTFANELLDGIEGE